ncbi:unnamed protein product [Toxocara canis]|uniref:Homeobox domain-containing protein n=1 Tax=Toxocara canis TaxID=6265 RepID=A0A183USQ1_TOXCA|nr:unnamed protein product [Toxocara canis]
MEEEKVGKIDCICEALYQAHDGEKLVELFRPDIQNIMFYRYRYSSSVLRAYLYALFHMRRFEELFQAIAANTFEQKYFEELQDLWYKARYAEVLRQFYKRNKYPTLEDKKEIARITDLQIVQVYIRFIANNLKKKVVTSMPCNTKGNLTVDNIICEQNYVKVNCQNNFCLQISNWFKNRRQRDKSSSDRFSPPVQLQFDSLLI